MKEMYIIVIVLLTSWTAGSWAAWELPCPVTKCPYPENYPVTNLPHENDCTKFYKCSVGVPVLQDCPPIDPKNKEIKLHYNRRLQVCDWPWLAGCEECTKVMNDKCPQADKIGNLDDDCNSYIDCKDGKTKLCPKGTCFSRTCQACVSNRADGKCESNGRKLFPVCIEGDRQRHEMDCSLYYECINIDYELTYILRHCYDGLHFNPKTKECDKPANAGCQVAQ